MVRRGLGAGQGGRQGLIRKLIRKSFSVLVSVLVSVLAVCRLAVQYGHVEASSPPNLPRLRNIYRARFMNEIETIINHAIFWAVKTQPWEAAGSIIYILLCSTCNHIPSWTLEHIIKK